MPHWSSRRRYESTRPRRRAAPATGLACVALLAICLLAAACSRLLFGGEVRRAAAYAELSGTVVGPEPHAGAYVVVLLGERHGHFAVIDHGTTDEAGRFSFIVTPGRYRVAAFADPTGELIVRPDSLVAPPDPERTLTVEANQVISRIALVLSPRPASPDEAAIDIGQAIAEDEAAQTQSAGRLFARGEIVSLEDPRFDRNRASEGLTRWVTTLETIGAGIYFLEPYDPGKIPVLFIHGISGTPREFAHLATQIDRARLQPWFAHYPSGFDLDGLAGMLLDVLHSIHARSGFGELYLVAHSMGGLIAREMILLHAERGGTERVTLFASIATPWGGMRFARMAQLMAQLGGTFPPSWLDLAPDGQFVSKLFYQPDGTPRRLPTSVDYRLFFGYGGSYLDGYLNPVEHPADGVVSLASQLRMEARREAGGAVYAIDDDHTGVLRNEETLAYLNAVFENALARAGRGDGG